MMNAFFLLLVATLAGCATNKAVLPSLEGKPRIQINKQMPAPSASPASTSETQGK